MSAPVVFISYSHDSDEHRGWVTKVAVDLRDNGVDVTLDLWDLVPGQDMALFMQRSVADSDRVIMVCSENYVQKADGGSGGVGYERLIITNEVVANIDTKKFIPLVRGNTSHKKTPTFMGPRLYIDFSNDDEYQAKLEELARAIHNMPASVKPPLGTNPYSGLSSQGDTAPELVPASSPAILGTGSLQEPWFAMNAEAAASGHGKLGFKALMEVRFALHSPIDKSRIDLRDAVRRSQIETTGWPFGILLENSAEYQPKPTADGIRAEIPIERSALSGRASYDYWALRNTGDFFLLQNLSEDESAPDAVFFDVRLVRVTEALMFAANLYEALGVPVETKLSIRISHRGIAGRRLSSAGPRWVPFHRHIEVDGSEGEFVGEVGRLRDNLVSAVRKIAEPLFMLFDFSEFKPQVYEEIITRFAQGRMP